MAPEQMRSARDVDGRADIWSVGVLLYRMLSGRVPFPGGPMEVAGALMTETTPPPIGRPDVPAALEAIVFDCLQYDLRRRVAGAVELANRLLPFANGGYTAQTVPPAGAGSLLAAAGSAPRERRWRRALPRLARVWERCARRAYEDRGSACSCDEAPGEQPEPRTNGSRDQLSGEQLSNGCSRGGRRAPRELRGAPQSQCTRATRG